MINPVFCYGIEIQTLREKKAIEFLKTYSNYTAYVTSVFIKLSELGNYPNLDIFFLCFIFLTFKTAYTQKYSNFF